MKILVEETKKICKLDLYNIKIIDVMPAMLFIAENAGIISSLRRLPPSSEEGYPEYAVSAADYAKLYELVSITQNYMDRKADKFR